MSRPLGYTGIMRLRFSRMVLGLALAAAFGFAQQVPRPAGEFVISMNDGSQILLSQYGGKVVLLVFMFTT
jgi:hypothetical protein